MDGQEIQLIEDGGCLEIRINREERKNALTFAMYRAMIAGLEKAAASDAIRMVLFTAEGETFSAGNDLGDFAKITQTGDTAAFDFIRAVAEFEKPLVAAVKGNVVGVGTTMLFHFDLVYAADDAKFMMPFVNLGLVPEAASSLLAPEFFGRPRASRMLLLGEPMGAADAAGFGFVSEVVAAADLDAHVRGKVKALLAKAPQALQTTRRLIAGDRTAVMARIDEEAALFDEALRSDEVKEAISAFFEKRAPKFT